MEQRRALADQIGQMKGYLYRLKCRMEAKRFDADDRLYQLVIAADDAFHRLWVASHYLSCDTGVGLRAETTRTEPPLVDLSDHPR